ncbi:MAG: restriction endonuclease [Candidatus Pacebacteria bacterium]|nr:restriction endonuclease [Candidatus Paceibacterota bacterium]
MQPQIVKSDGTKELFDSNKLLGSLLRARASKTIAEDIVEKINKEIRENMTTSQIYDRAFDLLNNRSKRTAMKYSIRRSVLNLGPTGFPFEKYIAEIFKAKGYETRTGQMLQGKCLEHEVDMVAWNDKELIVAEIKFHNEINAKSDTKVALYVKARFDDLKSENFKIAGKNRKIGRAMLITNTKFTTNAKKYVQCVGTFEMISWDYPSKDNLFDLIEETQMHPMTCIPTLTKKNQQDLLKKGIVNCMSLKNKSSALKEVGVSDEKINDILENIETLCMPE